ncbi:MAG TPA: 3-hydroxybutyryl-CoA dehydrogenase [Mycobacteriales bacterium]|nr:3-hydroxybutyryl-CoA dehydrogenase [Mycobacteriales bacterium]
MERVGVIGSGIMGAGIAEVAARSGCEVVVREVTAELAEAGRARIAASLDRAVTRGKLAAADRDATLDRIRTTTSLDDLADRDLVIEAIVEDEPTKTALYRELSGLVRPDCVLASNTSSIPISRLAAAAQRPERVLGMHFFNPVPVLPLVELVPSLRTGQSTVDTARAFAEGRLGKKTVLCKDRAGFVVNALLVPYLLAAIRMVEAGVATAEDVDTAIVAGANHPMGPLAPTDLIGLDTTAAVAVSMYEEFKEPLYAAPPLLLRMVEAGLLGRKSGQGFFSYGS